MLTQTPDRGPSESGYVCRSDEEVIMGYSLACGDVMPGCAATFRADTEDELLAQVGPHAADAHGITEITPDVLEAVKGAIKQD